MRATTSGAIATLLVSAVLGGDAVAATPTVFDQRTVTHYGMVVRDVEKTARSVADVFGLEMPPIRETKPVPLAKGYQGDTNAYTRVADVRFDNIVLEIIQPIGGKSPWKDFLDAHGEGLHHLSIPVPDVDAYVALLTSKGGTRTLGKAGGDYALVDMMSHLAFVIELTQGTAGVAAASKPIIRPDPLIDPDAAWVPGFRNMARIGLMVADGDLYRERWMTLFGVPVNPARGAPPGARMQYPDDFAGDPLARNREIYVPLNNTWVNLIQPVGGKSPWSDLLGRRQGGHYLLFFVEDVNEADAFLTKKGGHRILGNKNASYSYNDMNEALGGLTILLLNAKRHVDF
jgi:catechol 2,3-dioxygenase-like lactoylglutathione lyase family enzyme